MSAFAAFEPLAASYHLAAGLAEDTIVADPTGALRAMQRRVARTFRREAWVRRRCDDAARRVEELLAGVESGADWNERVTAWIFAAGVTTHVLLVAALANPTVRLRYLAVRRVLDAHGASAFYPLLLELLGCAGLRAARVAHHVDALATAFDAAAAAGRTPFPFSSDVTPLARPIAIDGCRALVRSGDPREAVFWLLVSFARCDRILAADAPEAAERNAPAFAALLADVGVAGPADLRDRAARVRAALPGVRRAAETILAANPRVVAVPLGGRRAARGRRARFARPGRCRASRARRTRRTRRRCRSGSSHELEAVEAPAGHDRRERAAEVAEHVHRAADTTPRVAAADREADRPRRRDAERGEPPRPRRGRGAPCVHRRGDGADDRERREREADEPGRAQPDARAEAARERVGERAAERASPAAMPSSGSAASQPTACEIEAARAQQIGREPGEVEVPAVDRAEVHRAEREHVAAARTSARPRHARMRRLAARSRSRASSAAFTPACSRGSSRNHHHHAAAHTTPTAPKIGNACRQRHALEQRDDERLRRPRRRAPPP